MAIGKLIVIEGGDGAGKATQTKLLADALRSQRRNVKTLSFPRYKDSFYGKLVGRFLAGEFGNLESTSPYLAALIYALDREDARDEIKSWLNDEMVVVLDRYVPSSLAHQAAKLPKEKQSELIKWIEEMEYDVNSMPRPDLVIYLHVPIQQSLDLIHKKAKVRDYTTGTDIAENKPHQEKAEEVFIHLSLTKQNWKTVECVKDGVLRSIADIHTELLQIVENVIMKT